MRLGPASKPSVCILYFVFTLTSFDIPSLQDLSSLNVSPNWGRGLESR